ncbi:hypothetical protein AVEN_89661-1 [Araneus ventricosus]|uniref:Uncharacterized protein n=1 Tax=Araneus ventricosus TaxID=182803 RepID=A0A4Y2ETX0_ARAVE|nr:hypothetical protein AVEN_89661-1 [Araneus ventricosus]
MKQPPDATSSSDSDPDFPPSPRPQTCGLRTLGGSIPRTQISPPTNDIVYQYSYVILEAYSRPDLPSKFGNTTKQSELLFFVAESWISSRSKDPSFHLDCRTIKVGGVIVGGEASSA